VNDFVAHVEMLLLNSYKAVTFPFTYTTHEWKFPVISMQEELKKRKLLTYCDILEQMTF